jgi:hypothetical protein
MVGQSSVVPGRLGVAQEENRFHQRYPEKSFGNN